MHYHETSFIAFGINLEIKKKSFVFSTSMINVIYSKFHELEIPPK